ncbi:hypothetical protein DEI99_005325 [Curtobacterium sp. MCLR17_036]|uniref:hypothetical protein n=1 Tax=Curtobacterium sp. MCLR17_036 TaxID=2175620 RepID=UPI000DA960EB|nr:hypothetical protein [Curtobacterium sp. MCLR17_036]WIE65960.1 hypothetical protein DEI99_005325 [Curtobacterium sp. MCLR17_036]
MERLVIQRATTGDVLSYDFRGASRAAFTRELSAVGTMPLTIGAAQAKTTASDGLPMFDEWGTIVTLDDDGEIRFRGIVTDVQYAGPEWKLTLSALPTVLYGIPYDDTPYYGAEVDPASIVRKLVAHVQSYPDSDVGLTVVGSTPVRVGSFSTQRRIEAVAYYNEKVADYKAENKKLQDLRKIVAGTRKTAAAQRTSRANSSKDLTAAKKALTAAKSALTKAKSALTAAKKTKDSAKIAAAQTAVNNAQAGVTSATGVVNDRQAALNGRDSTLDTTNARIKAQQADVDAQAAIVKTMKERKDKASELKNAAQQQESDDGGAYALEPWEAQDCGRLIDDLAKDAPFDWVEEHYWASDVPQTRIRIAHPRTGRRLSGDSDPSFQQGVNITVQLQPASTGSDYANTVFGIGAGEGAGSIRRTISKRDNRIRRVATLQSKDIKSKQDMTTRLQAELIARQQNLAVDSITVANHPNSPRGSYSIGDDIYVQGDVPHYGRFGLWHRIVGITENTNGTTEVSLRLTDSFTYGAGVEA